MIEKFKGLDKAAKIRLIVFILLMGWCLYLGIGFASEVNLAQMSSDFVDTSQIKDVNIDGGDFTWAVLLMGYGVNGLLSLVFIFITAIYAVVEAVVTLVPTLLFRLIGVKKNSVISKDEYTLTKYLYRGSLVISLVGGLIASRFSGIISILLYTAIWALITQIYVYDIRSRSK